MTQSEFDRRIQQESRNPIVDDDIKAEKKSFGHRLQCILKAEEHDVKHFGFHTTDRKITLHHKDQIQVRARIILLRVFRPFAIFANRNVRDIVTRNNHD